LPRSCFSTNGAGVEEAFAHLLHAACWTHRIIECACVMQDGRGWGTRAGGALARAYLTTEFACTAHLRDTQRAELAVLAHDVPRAIGGALNLARLGQPGRARFKLERDLLGAAALLRTAVASPATISQACVRAARATRFPAAPVAGVAAARRDG